MARSAPERIAAIRQKIEKADAARQRAEQEFEQMIQPLKRKLVTVAEAASDTFVREHIEEMDSLNLSRKEQATLEAKLLALFEETLAKNASRQSADGDDDGATETAPETTTETTPEPEPYVSNDDLNKEINGGL